MVRPVLINFSPDEFHYYSFIISQYKCDGITNTAKDPFRKMFVPSKIENVNLKVFNMIK